MRMAREYQSGSRIQTHALHAIRVARKAFSALVGTSQQRFTRRDTKALDAAVCRCREMGGQRRTRTRLPPLLSTTRTPATEYLPFPPFLSVLPDLSSMNPPPSSPLVSPSYPVHTPSNTPYPRRTPISPCNPQAMPPASHRTRAPSSHAPRVRSPSHHTTCDLRGRWIDTCALSVPGHTAAPPPL